MAIVTTETGPRTTDVARWIAKLTNLPIRCHFLKRIILFLMARRARTLFQHPIKGSCNWNPVWFFRFQSLIKSIETVQYGTGWETGVYSLPEIIKSIMTQVCHTASGKTLRGTENMYVRNSHSLSVTSTRVSKSLDETWALVVSFEATFAPETFTADYFSFYKLRESAATRSHNVCCISAGVASNSPTWLIFPQ